MSLIAEVGTTLYESQYDRSTSGRSRPKSPRKTNTHSGLSLSIHQPEQRVKGELKVPLRNCSTCGGQLLRGQHVNCPTCWSFISGQDFYTRKTRGEAISRSKESNGRWREEHPQKGDPEVYRREVLPGLEGVPLSRIMDACEVAKSTASAIRSGKTVPAERHWDKLLVLGTAQSSS